MKWVYPLEGTTIRSTAAATEHHIYICDWKGRIWKLDAVTGQPVYHMDTPSMFTSSPAIEESRLYVCGCDSVIYAFDLNNRTVQWTAPLKHISVSSPQVDGQSVYFGTHEGSFICLNKKNGRLRWNHKMLGPIPASAALDDKYVYITASEGQLLCLDKNKGVMKWQASLPKPSWASPLILDSLIIAGDTHGHLCAFLRDTGEKRWITAFEKNPSFMTEAKRKNRDVTQLIQIVSTAATDLTRVYVNTSDGQIVCADPLTGELIWKTVTQEKIFAPPLVTPGCLFISTMSEHLLILDKRDGRILQTLDVTGTVYASPVICGNAVCFGTEKGRIYGFSEIMP